jgi:hypothetical protein
MQYKKGDKRSIELIQDFEMPGVSTNIKITPDGNFILVTGIYKPRIKCYDVLNLSMKFERCFDSEVVNFVVLSQDYGKVRKLSNQNHDYCNKIQVLILSILACISSKRSFRRISRTTRTILSYKNPKVWQRFSLSHAFM